MNERVGRMLKIRSAIRRAGRSIHYNDTAVMRKCFGTPLSAPPKGGAGAELQ